MRRGVIVVSCALAGTAAMSAVAQAKFPYGTGKPAYHTGPGQVPDDLEGDGNEFKFAATPEPPGGPGEPQNTVIRKQKQELCGIRGASVVDKLTSRPADSCAPGPFTTAWETTTGRADVAIAVLDSGIKWNEPDTEAELRRKLRINQGELPKPRVDRGKAMEPGAKCADYRGGRYDANGDSVFNVVDYACDSRVNLAPAKGVGPPDVLDPQDVLIAFTDGRDDDNNGFKDDIAGWDFLDNDNDPYDDVQYGHGTGEAKDSSSEADNAAEGAGQTGSCPNCMFVPLRVGDSFIADASRFAQATIYAVDNDVLVVQEALGTLNNTALARAAIDYAYHHGVAVIASAADEAAQHHNQVSELPHAIVVNSARPYDETFTPQPRSYLQFNGCTNFSSKISIAIPSTSCSSNATGLAAGMAGLVYSAALNAHDGGKLDRHPDCRRVGGSRCVISANEVRQLMASGTLDGRAQAEDVNFASGNDGSGPEPFCGDTPAPGCTDPNQALQTLVNANRPVVSPLVDTRSYPARKGHDQFYGWGRINAARAVEAPTAGDLPPEVEITSPDWFEQVDPEKSDFKLKGQIAARGARFTCRVLVAPGSYPNNDEAPAGDFSSVPISSPGVCDGSPHEGDVDGIVARIDIAKLKQRFPPDADSFDGPEPGAGAGQTSNGRPNSEPYGFVVKVVATAQGAQPSSGEDRRNFYLHRDQDMLRGFPRTLPSDGESSPLLVDLDGDNRNELVFGTADGIVHAMRPDGKELPGWPVRNDRLPLHTGGKAFRSGEVKRDYGGAFLASMAVGDLDRDGSPEVVGADFEGKIYAWNSRGKRLWKRESNDDYSGRPLRPFENVRKGKTNRTQHGFLGSPVLADLDGKDGSKLEVIAAAMDRHVYAFNHDGSRKPGFPVLVVDRTKLGKIDSRTHAVRFAPGKLGEELDQGAIVDTPAVADLDGDRKPEIVVGTNEEYSVNKGNEGGLNAGPQNSASIALLITALGDASPLKPANGRVYAIKNSGDPGEPAGENSKLFLSGWPVPIARINAELLPVVGEGITGYPVISPKDLECASGKEGPKVGVMPDAGIAYVLDKHGDSCQGQSGGKDNGLQTDSGTGDQDRPVFPAVGHPAFGDFAGGISFVAPATGLLRALDVAAPEYQSGSQDFLSAWDPSTPTGEFRSGFPARVNDLQFLTGPSVGDVDGGDDEELVGGTAHLDVQAFKEDGQPADGWPKLTSDWTVANPVLGSFGTLDTDDDARKVVVSMTRSGFMFAYQTEAASCSPSSWPRFHHDNANSGYYDRDAVAPGKPMHARVKGNQLTFEAPGDDLLCGTATRYQIVQSRNRITASDFGGRDQLSDAPAPAEAGTTQSYTLSKSNRSHVGIRALDEQGNPGPFEDVVAGRSNSK